MSRTVVAVALVVLAAVPAAGQLGDVYDFGLIVAQQSRPSFSLIGAGARPAGMGGAFTALADDASAASFNPAGLALLIVPEASVVVTHRAASEDLVAVRNAELYDPIVVSPAESSWEAWDLNFAAFTVPFEVAERNLCVQLSFHRQIDSSLAAVRELGGARDDQVVADFDQRFAQEGGISTFSIAGAYQVTQRLALGVNLAKWTGGWDFTSTTAVADLARGEEWHVGYDYGTDFSGWSWNAGGLLSYRYLNVGFTYRAAFDADLGFWEAVTDTNLAPGAEPVQADTLGLAWPASWTLGVALKPTDTWRVTVDYARYNWSEMLLSGIGPEHDETVNFFDLAPPDESETADAGEWRAGSELHLFAGDTVVALRAGYFWEPRPVRLFSMPVGRTEEDGFSLGAGAKRGAWSVDVAYQLRRTSTVEVHFIDPRIVEADDPEFFYFGPTERTEHRVYLSLLYQFSRESLEQAFSFLFVGPTAHGSDGGS